MKIKAFLLGLIAALSFTWQSAKALDLPEIIGDHMMLQQNTEARIWGWAKGGSIVNVTTSWNHKMYTATANRKTGRWEVMVKTPEASFDEQYININGQVSDRPFDGINVVVTNYTDGSKDVKKIMK